MQNISVLIIAKDEEDRIGKALESVKWAREIVVVVDDRTIDKTAEVARQFTSKVFIRPWEGFVKTKVFALDQVATDWVLWLDGDEELTPQLNKEIQSLPDEAGEAAFFIHRRSNFMGRWMEYSWSPKRDKPIRLFLKDKVRFDESKLVHEEMLVDGPIGELKSLINHYTFKGFVKHLDRINLYSSLSAQEMNQKGVQFHWPQLFLQPFYAFLLSFIKRQGFRDGLRGFILCAFYSYNVFCDYAKLWEIQLRETH